MYKYFVVLIVSILFNPIGFTVEQKNDRLVANWIFGKDNLTGQIIHDTKNHIPATIKGPAYFESFGQTEALLIDKNQNLITLPYDLESKILPQKELTVETWVNIEKTAEWGGLVGAFQNNGGFQKGWLLGFKQSNFSFVLSSEGANDGDGKSTEIRANSSLQWGQWHHVAATYDGFEMKLYVDGELQKSSGEQTGHILYPETAPFVIGAYKDQDEDFRWRGWIHEARIYGRALTPKNIAEIYNHKRKKLPEVLEFDLGPYLRRLSKESFTLFWKTDKPVISKIEYGTQFPLAKQHTGKQPVTEHQITLTGIQYPNLYYYRIIQPNENGQERASRLFEFDSSFDYTPTEVKADDYPQSEEEWKTICQNYTANILNEIEQDKGFCLVIGAKDGQLAYEITRQTRMKILIIDDDKATVNQIRKQMDKAGLYGVRISAHHIPTKQLPYGDYFANLIVSESLLAGESLSIPAHEIYRVLRPSGGLAYLGQSTKAAKHQKPLNKAVFENHFKHADIPELKLTLENETTAKIKRAPLPGGGEWSHMYADAGNSSNSHDQHLQDPMHVLWFGRPGPRPMVDRGTRPPAPLSTNGRLFIQGDRRLFGLDAYNGTILWTLEVPDLRRANIPRDSSNMAADGDSLYIVVKDKVWCLNGATGEIEQTYNLPSAPTDREFDWGYIASVDELLIGSTVPEGGIYIGADGEWYDAQGYESHKVISSSLFVLDPKTGKKKWDYQGGAIINPSIAAGDGTIYFVESRNPEALREQSGRLYKEITSEQYLVALDIQTGKVVWEQQQDFTEGRWVFYLTYSDNTLIALSTTDKYQLYAFDAKDGKPMWNHEYAWYRDHHGGAMQHPVIVGDTVYAEPKVFKLKSGEDTGVTMPQRNKCGVITASANCLFYRDYYHAMWDLKKNVRKDWIGIRPGCWLNLITAGGLMLAPEASSGCYCAHPIQTTVAFIPKE